MKTNNFLFSNFSTEIFPSSINKNLLTIKHIYNLTTENNIIEPTFSFSNYFKTYFKTTETYNSFIQINSTLIDSIIYATEYTYYDSNLNETISRLFLIDSSFNLYELDNKTLIINFCHYTFLSFPEIENFNNKLYFISKNDLFLMIDEGNEPITITSNKNISSFIKYHNYSLFSINEDKFSIYFAEDTEFHNIEDSFLYQSISLSKDNGAINKIIVYKDNVYIIQQYSISKLTIKDSSFSITSYCSIQSKIYHETICIIDDYVVFYTSAGLYIFDGNDIKQIFKNITSSINSSNLKAVAYNNRYYLLSNVFINNISSRCIIEFDIENNICKFHNIGNVQNIYVIRNLNNYYLISLIVYENKYEVACTSSKHLINVEKYIKFNKITFDNNNIKVLNEIKFQSVGNFKIRINSDIQSAEFEIFETKNISNIGLKGQVFEIEIFSDSAFAIESISIKTTSYSED